ncbi:VC0807 family protein [Pseudoalteromonas mariniglutinosa]|uniref:VC0807 family protein n=1 Tax=Pseudoalteromonas mariniglutinosa TaxID=206042 RepID=UPI00384D3328
MSKAPKKNNFFSNLIFNIILPAVILSRFSSDDSLGPIWAVIIALSLPLLFGIWELKQSGKVNFFSVLGIISVLLTGGISLLKLDPSYIAVKEAMVPGLIGVVVFISQFTPYPLVRKLLINPDILDTEKLATALAQQNNTTIFDNKVRYAGFVVASAFFLSSVLNYILAKAIVVSPAGTSAYAEELGRMTWLSYPVIALPTMVMLFGAIIYTFMQIKKLTQQPIDDFILS